MSENKIIEDLIQAYIYATPIVMAELTYSRERNVLLHDKGLVTDKDKHIARPAVDTVYSSAFIDLSSSPTVFRTPSSKTKMFPHGRYCTYEITDAYTNCVALLGTGFVNDDEGGTYLFVKQDYKGEIPEGMTRVDIPTNMSWLFMRALTSSEEDLGEIYEIQKQLSLAPLYPDKYRKRVFPDFPFPADTPNNMFDKMDIETFFNMFNRLAVENPAYDYDKPVLEAIKKYGIGAGLTFSLSQFPEDIARDIAAELPQKALKRMKDVMRQERYMDNGWVFSHKALANFGDNYEYRAYMAIYGINGNPKEMAVYLSGVKDNNGDRLSGNRRYRIRFKKGELPPVSEKGFWSITAYADCKYLVPNPYNRFRVHCGSKFKYNGDGSLDILVQEKAPEDGSMFENYLPCGNGAFDLQMRTYLPLEPMIERTWRPPVIERID